jgi:hypothetical protein
MENFKLKRRLVFLGMIAAVLFILTPSGSVLAGEPGQGACEGIPFDPPPFIGDITVTLIYNVPTLTGRVERVGSSDCTGIFTDVGVGFLSSGDFADLKPSDIQGTCLANESLFIPAGCIGDDALLTILGVGRMRWFGNEEFEAQFVIMAH